MRVSLAWLAELVDVPGIESLCERLTYAGLEIESIERGGPDLSGYTVGLVLERRAHPDADRLSVCRVDLRDPDGPVEIVCGAPNVAAGQRVCVVRPGQKLPDGTKIKKTKIRGITSLGMICSQRELGIGDDHEGIWVLPEDAEVGAPVSEALPLGDTVIDLEITPNRGDWASMLGIAREVRAQFGGELRLPAFGVEEAGRASAEDVRVDISDPAGCHRYVARIVRGVRVGPSPEWVVQRLEAAGLRSINNVVDATNLVMLELGQPLHAFDLATLRGGRIDVRAAREGEKLATLDDQTRELGAEDLVIADAERAIALAGVMGGAETEVSAATRDLLIESAHFAPSRVRRTARRLGLHSDASYRFERGIDPAGVARAADRCARLIAELAGGEVSSGRVEAVGDVFPHVDEIELAADHPTRLLGIDLVPDEIAELLERVDVSVEPRPDGRLSCRIPSYRNDLAVPVDLVEEVARVYGYDRIPTTLPTAPLQPVRVPEALARTDRLRDLLVTEGLLETRTFPAMRDADFDALRLEAGDPARSALAIRNPMIAEDRWLQTSLLPGLLRATARNLARQVERVRLFEVGWIFVPRADDLPEEPERAAFVLTRGEPQSLWDRRDPPPLFFEGKGIAERVVAGLGLTARFLPGTDRPYLHPGASGSLRVGKAVVGQLGELHPEVAAAYQIDRPVLVAELDLAALGEQRPRAVRHAEVSPYPAVRRDLAVLVGSDRPAGDILEQVRRSAGNDATAAEIFDRYVGKGIPEGKVSLGFRLTFQRPDRTLTDAEVQEAVDRVVRMLAERFGGELR